MTRTFFQFLTNAPTSFHAAKEIGICLAEADFESIGEWAEWRLQAEHDYYVTRAGSLIAAFRMPKQKPTSAVIIACHTDSPALKIKPNPDVINQGISQLLTEVYGAPILHSWLDRDLAIAGRIETDTGSKLVYLDQNPVVIPQLAIHLDKSVHEKGFLVHKQDHLKAIFSIQGTDTLETVLRKNFAFDKMYSHDLFLVPLEKPNFTGLHRELISGYRLDNLSSGFACLGSIIMATPREETLQIAIFWDHEEVGSTTPTGASCHFVDQLLERIGLALHQTREEFHRLKSSSIILSADVTHGWNPNFPEKYDPQNSPHLGKGVVIKFNAGKRYASDATSVASICKICDAKNIPLQQGANRSDIQGGSTVGPIMAANTGIPTIDLGIACWAMHSSREIVSASDLQNLGDLMKTALDVWNPTKENG
jgi:aspartyl aminopeptidase